MSTREATAGLPASDTAHAGGQRQLGFWMCTALVIGNTIGIGIFMQPASLAPYGFNAFIGWAITVVGCLVLALVFAGLARRMMNADGPFEYIRATQGVGVAFLALWCYWVSTWVSNAAIAVGVVGYLIAVFPPLRAVSPAVLAVALLWVLIAINLLGLRAGGRVQVTTTILKLAPMAVVIGLGLWTLIADPSSYAQNLPTTPVGLQGVMAASTIALFAMLGLESASVPAGRVRDPERTIPRATLVGTVLTAVIYLAVSAIALLIVPQETLAMSTSPFVDVLDRLANVGGGRWLAFFIVISGLGALNGWTLLVGELTRSLAARGLMPAALSRCNRHGAPAAALVVTGLLASAVTLMNYSKSLVDGFTFLTIVVTAANLPLYLCCALALVVLWSRNRRGLPRSMLWLGLGGAIYSIFVFVGVGREAFLWALVLAAAGLPFYLWWRMRRQPEAAA